MKKKNTRGSNWLNKATAFVMGAVKDASLGFNDEMGAGVQSLFNSKSYKENLKEARDWEDKIKKANPKFYKGGELASGVGGALLIPGGAPGKLLIHLLNRGAKKAIGKAGRKIVKALPKPSKNVKELASDTLISSIKALGNEKDKKQNGLKAMLKGGGEGLFLNRASTSFKKKLKIPDNWRGVIVDEGIDSVISELLELGNNKLKKLSKNNKLPLSKKISSSSHFSDASLPIRIDVKNLEELGNNRLKKLSKNNKLLPSKKIFISSHFSDDSPPIRIGVKNWEELLLKNKKNLKRSINKPRATKALLEGITYKELADKYDENKIGESFLLKKATKDLERVPSRRFQWEMEDLSGLKKPRNTIHLQTFGEMLPFFLKEQGKRLNKGRGKSIK